MSLCALTLDDVGKYSNSVKNSLGFCSETCLEVVQRDLKIFDVCFCVCKHKNMQKCFALSLAVFFGNEVM